MPIYEYHCHACGKMSDILHRSYTIGPVSCPGCGSDQMEKLISTPGGLISRSGDDPGPMPCSEGTCMPNSCADGGCQFNQ